MSNSLSLFHSDIITITTIFIITFIYRLFLNSIIYTFIDLYQQNQHLSN